MNPDTNFHAALRTVQAEIDACGRPYLVAILSPRLGDALIYALLGGGKYLRPYLLIETARMLGTPREKAVPAALSLECVHAYSLIHDDLPCMDDDDLRRGQPTLHRAFDEATAILAGDALLTLSFQILAESAFYTSAQKVALIGGLARASGAAGMVAGQMLDLAAEGRFATTPPVQVADITQLHDLKTGALIRYALDAACIIAAVPENASNALREYGRALGRLYQLADDLLDVTASAEEAGKAVGKDEKRGKATLVSLFGRQEAQNELQALLAQALSALDLFPQADRLRDLARFVAAPRRNDF